MTTEQLTELGWKLAGWLAVPLIGLAANWLLSQAKRASSDQHNATLALLSKVAVMAVTAAEQTISENPDRKRAALTFVDSYLHTHGINLPTFEIEAAIESAVLTQTPHEGQVVTLTPLVSVGEHPERKGNGDLRSLAGMDTPPVGPQS